MHTRSIYNRATGPYSQKGAALAVGLLMLLAMTVLGVAALSTSTLQERMASNLRQMNIAMNGAESALVEAETWIDATVDPTTGQGGLPEPATSCSAPCNGDAPVWAEDDDDIAAHTVNIIRQFGRLYGHDYSGASPAQVQAMDLVATPPAYMIEEMTFNPAASGGSLGQGRSSLAYAGERYLRITATSTGQTPLTEVVVQSVHVTRY